MKNGKFPRRALVALAVTSMALASCASGWRSCREWTNLASKDASSGNVGDVIPGVIYLAISPLACGSALLLSPINEVMDGRDEPERSFVSPTPDPAYESPTPTPAS